MNVLKRIVPVTACCFLMTSCISSTTGRIQPEANIADAARLNYELGARYYKNGSYELARDRLILAAEFDPNYSVAYTALALTYEALDKQRLAVESYEKALKVAPRNFEVQNLYAVYLCRQEEYDNAQQLFDKAIDHPENDRAFVTLTNAGVCMRQKPDAELAERYYRQALDRKANHGEALLQICLLKYEEKDYLSARAFLQRFLAGNAPTAEILYLASRIEGLLDNDRNRREYEDRLLREFPTSSEARKVLAAD